MYICSLHGYTHIVAKNDTSDKCVRAIYSSSFSALHNKGEKKGVLPRSVTGGNDAES